MSNLVEIRRAYECLRDLLDQEIRKRRGDAKALERYRHWLDTAFYLVAWANFEHETKKQAETVIAEEARRHGRARHAWSFVHQRLRDFSLARQIELVFHNRAEVTRDLEKHYLIRNAAAHGNKRLPAEARDLPGTIAKWEQLVDRF